MDNMTEANIQLLASIKQERSDAVSEDDEKYLNTISNSHAQMLTNTTSINDTLIIKKEEPDDSYNIYNTENGNCNDIEHNNMIEKQETNHAEDYHSRKIKQECPGNTDGSVLQDMFIVSDFMNSKSQIMKNDFADGHSHIDNKKLNSNKVKKSFQCPLCHLKFYKFTLFTKHAECHSTKDISLKVKNTNSIDENLAMQFSSEQEISLNDSRNNSTINGVTETQISNVNVPVKKKRIRKPYISTKMHYCDECDYSSNHLNNYRTHKRKHTGERPFSCDQCSYTSAQLVHLKSHRLIHTDDKPHLCFLCQFKTRDIRYLKRHTKRHFKDKKFECNQCVFSCDNIVEWLAHNAIHTAEPSLQCGNCDFSCKRQDRMDIHLRVHSGETPYQCNDCKFSCNDLSLLRKHNRIHNPKGPLLCDECPYTTIWSRHMSLHKRTHTGEKPYACDKCDYTCSQIGHLKTHRRVHTGEKPYSCDLCDHTSSQVSHMKLHILSHSEEKPFKCPLCTFCCKTGQDLRRHSKKHM